MTRSPSGGEGGCCGGRGLQHEGGSGRHPARAHLPTTAGRPHDRSRGRAHRGRVGLTPTERTGQDTWAERLAVCPGVSRPQKAWSLCHNPGVSHLGTKHSRTGLAGQSARCGLVGGGLQGAQSSDPRYSEIREQPRGGEGANAPSRRSRSRDGTCLPGVESLRQGERGHCLQTRGCPSHAEREASSG